MERAQIAKAFAVVALVSSGCAGAESDLDGASNGALGGGGGAAFTTWDVVRGGCLDDAPSSNCNAYRSKEDVFLGGGPASAALGNGRWYFAVIAPGSPHDVVDGARGNLSDARAAGLVTDLGSGTLAACRTFLMRNGRIDTDDYAANGCAHALGTGPSGRPAIQLFPFDDTPNAEGTYQLAICREGGRVPQDCKSDNFSIVASLQDPVFAGLAYYDANANGQHDPGEVGVPGWLVDVGGATSETLTTGADGTFSTTRAPGHWTFTERPAVGWVQSGNTVDQSSVTGDATVALASFAYAVDAAAGAGVSGLFFGNVCLGEGGAHGLGYWANRGNGDVTGDDLAGLASLHLRNTDGTDADPSTAAALSVWLLDARSPNMARMLSAQLAATWLSVQHGDVDPSAIVYAPGTSSANGGGFLTIGALVAEAGDALLNHPTSLAGDASRAWLEAIKDALDAANGNGSFVQPGPERCPLPVFP